MDWLDPILKALATASGIGLIGLMLVRVNPRGRWRIVRLEPERIIDPQMKSWAVMLCWVFGVVAFLAMLRGY